MNESITKRVKLSKFLTLLAIVLLLGTYTLKPIFSVSRSGCNGRRGRDRGKRILSTL